MDDRYFRLWRLFQERIAKSAEKEDEYGSLKTARYETLALMAKLEAEVTLEE